MAAATDLAFSRPARDVADAVLASPPGTCFFCGVRMTAPNAAGARACPHGCPYTEHGPIPDVGVAARLEAQDA